ncbi:methylated-DNA--[protein]-cysteine S-methyltransferase [Dickeya chrysanthemi]|uniref:methylated-DNA--[protein]-cysteine S-methyltransferase n=1 Tax=Dickeya chrysanthemi TaxID=556 RepID=UPI0003A31AEC|nr:methylated-DNA--[protein]-cysteine S-methyltransferase [Dickeya chrysanthemi]MBX9447311.1 methylated-DNA--[protein]-cysteine S-methyltransferase [Dickeya chrysanthemi]MCA7006153.1 methylated-DNA--[protein]-cysteine S-methyltransferase [Dickeya chrysanthemi]
MQTFLFDSLSTPIGELLLITDENYHLRAVEWREYEEKLYQSLNKRYRHDPFVLKACNNPGELTDTLRAYFAGDLNIIDALPVAAAGTDFQRQVWQALRTIPCGSTTTYGELAARLGQPGAARAVGLANGSNPVSIVVPCHRVIGSQGTLTGYAGGIHRKHWLLTHEGYLPQQDLFNTRR